MTSSSSSPSLASCHFSGLAGGGMSALAWYLRLSGRAASGSDRAFDKGDAAVAATRAAMEHAGIRVTPQDGSGLTTDTTALVVSTAIEGDSPEIKRAKELGVPVLHRSELLALLSEEKKTIAVAGTSGKSTVTGMIWQILDAASPQSESAPSLITGANLPSLTEKGLPGNAFAGGGDWLVIEADESDGSLVRYRPEIAVLLNIEKDHQEIDALMPLFATFRERSKKAAVNARDARCVSLRQKGDTEFDPNEAMMSAGGFIVEDVSFGDWDSTFRWRGVSFRVPVPGRHNVENALAALAVATIVGVKPEDAARGLAAFKGVERRYVRVGEANGITVVDDFAHNPAKVRAALETGARLARKSGGRLLALFHPHGFAPMKLVGRDIMEEAAHALGPKDSLYVPPIYYAGGTADQSISSKDLVAHLNAQSGVAGRVAEQPAGIAPESKDAALAAVTAAARPGDVILSMGARDPALGDFAKRLLAALETR
ncbi:MAG TPA: Mur ligase family protein [Fibrobacteria bacterium]|jgi:UDP-N-acetylmuramate--alanine ligase|nr:Mur ligase family protein [Fibrobacteria bacterium]